MSLSAAFARLSFFQKTSRCVPLGLISTQLPSRRPVHVAFQPRLSLSTASAATSAKRERVAVIGSGNWGSVAAKIVGYNVLRQPQQFEPEVRMWVYEEQHHPPDEHIHKVTETHSGTRDCKCFHAPDILMCCVQAMCICVYAWF